MPQAQVVTSRVMTRSLPSTMTWVVQGMQGSNERMARRMSMPWNLPLSAPVLSTNGVFSTACS